MSEFRTAYRYAVAILGAAGEQNMVDQVAKDFEIVEKLLKDSHDFLVFLKSPVINVHKKRKILSDVFQGKIGNFTLQFIHFLTSKNREMILPEIMQQFYRLRDQQSGIVNATVKTAIPFSKQQEQELVKRLEHKTRKKVRLHYVMDKNIKGGYAVQVEDTVWDGSVAHQLEILRERFVEGSHLPM